MLQGKLCSVLAGDPVDHQGRVGDCFPLEALYDPLVSLHIVAHVVCCDDQTPRHFQSMFGNFMRISGEKDRVYKLSISPKVY
jgi:hypothetical protein